MTDPNQIASSLSEAQRNYMLNACEPCLWEDDRLWMNVTTPEMMSYLVKTGCHRALDHDLMIMALSPVGLAVRAIIERDSK